VSNAERQRRFRQRHPGYSRRYKAARKERVNAYLAARAAEAAAIAPRPQQLALPAPVEMLIIPGMNTIEAMPTPAPVPIELSLPLDQDKR
jgi:hypothetical protein